jgi:hypothetical protein
MPVIPQFRSSTLSPLQQEFNYNQAEQVNIRNQNYESMNIEFANGKFSMKFGTLSKVILAKYILLMLLKGLAKHLLSKPSLRQSDHKGI